MEQRLHLQGRTLSVDDIDFIRQLIADHSDWHRTRLSQELCRCWNWINGKGNLKDSVVLQQLAETLDVPVVASTGHADIMPSDHHLYAGQAGPRGNSVASGLTRNADLILALGMLMLLH